MISKNDNIPYPYLTGFLICIVNGDLCISVGIDNHTEYNKLQIHFVG